MSADPWHIIEALGSDAGSFAYVAGHHSLGASDIAYEDKKRPHLLWFRDGGGCSLSLRQNFTKPSRFGSKVCNLPSWGFWPGDRR